MTLTVRNLRFAYEQAPVLRGVNFTATSGDILGVLGPNGSGKSTLLRCIARLLTPDTGTVAIDGRQIKEFDREERARKIGYLSQTEERAFPASVFETILQGRRPHGGWRPSQRDRKAVERVVSHLSIKHLTDRAVSDLSGGQRQKVHLGRTLVTAPSVLLLDEPTSALDLRHRLEVMDLVTEYVQEQNVIGLIAIHDLNLAAQYCDRMALLSAGEIHTIGGHDVLTPATLREVYGVEASIREHRDRPLVVPEAPAGTE